MDYLQTFVHMGGYGGFVWPAFGVTILVMAALLLWSLRSLKARESALAALQAAGTGTRRNKREADDEA